MSNVQSQVIANCPNPKCGKPIYLDHSFSWCGKCGKPLPENVVARLPRIQARIQNVVTQAALAVDHREFSRPEHTQSGALMKRYWDAYLIARATVGFGTMIKAIGGVLAGLIFLGTMIAASQASSGVGFVILATGTAFAVFVGLLFFLLGVLVSAQGQILKASLDGAVNSSPFLTNEDRAEIMSLPTTQAMTSA